MSDVKLQRTIARFQAKIDQGAYYEAHQTLRTIINRYVKAGQYPEAIDLLFQGAEILLSKQQYASASDLLAYLVRTLVDSGTECASHRQIKYKLIGLIRQVPSADSLLIDLAKQSIAWSIEGASSKFGDNDLHHVFGVKFLEGIAQSAEVDDDRAKVFANAELHLILGTHESLPIYVDFLFEWWVQNRADAPDPGVLVARAVINYLYLRNLKFAQEALGRFLRQVVVLDNVQYDAIGPVYEFNNYDVANFLQLLVVTLGKADAGPKFMKLYNQYRPVLQHHGLSAPVEYLGRYYFNLQLGNANGNQNMLANLMGGLFK